MRLGWQQVELYEPRDCRHEDERMCSATCMRAWTRGERHPRDM